MQQVSKLVQIVIATELSVGSLGLCTTCLGCERNQNVIASVPKWEKKDSARPFVAFGWSVPSPRGF